MTYELKGKVVLITGAACGIGAGVVKALCDEGVKHVAVLDIDEANGIALQDSLNSKHAATKVKFYKCDVSIDDQLFGTFKAVKDANGYIDVVINNAGVLKETLDLCRKEIEINLIATVHGTVKAMEMMRKDEGGRGGTVINISSVGAMQQIATAVVYCGTKAAVLHFSNCVGLEDYYSRTDVRVLTICFGVTNTDIVNSEKVVLFDKKIEQEFKDFVQARPMQTVENAARGMIDMYKQGKSGSTWVSTNNKPVKEITDVVKRANSLLTEHVA